jgi:hypothetical protein
MNEASSAAVSTAKFVEGVLSASAAELAVGEAVAFSVALLAGMLLTTGVFGNRTKPINQVILEALRAISEQIADLRR